MDLFTSGSACKPSFTNGRGKKRTDQQPNKSGGSFPDFSALPESTLSDVLNPHDNHVSHASSLVRFIYFPVLACLCSTATTSVTMSRHHPDLVMCRKQPGISIGRLCDKCDGKCPVCDSYVRPTTLVRICDECAFGNYQNKCVVCGGEGISDAFYCFECTRLEKDRDGCPKIINLGSSRTDLFYQKKSFRNH